MQPHSAICKNCKGPLDWMKTIGWIHTGSPSCPNPQPKKDTIK